MLKKWLLNNPWIVQGIFGKGGSRVALHFSQREEELEHVCLRNTEFP